MYFIFKKFISNTTFVKPNIVIGIKDLLDIIEQNEYAADTEYNIDLKSLHNIKTELTEMNNMIGMEEMKKSVLDQLLYFVQELHVGKQISEFKHTVIYGSPGTGKTEIAKISGNMYSKLGILKNNVFKNKGELKERSQSMKRCLGQGGKT